MCAWRWAWRESSGEQRQVSDWQSWHPVINHCLPLYAVVCWMEDCNKMHKRLHWRANIIRQTRAWDDGAVEASASDGI